MGLFLGFLLFQRQEDPDLESSTVLRIATTQAHSTSWWDPPQPVITASKPLFSALPEDFQRTYYVQDHWACQAMIRALRQIGWTRVAQKENARLIYTNDRQTEWEFQPWQRHNHIPEPWQWEDSMAKDLREFNSNHTIYFLPAETYNLSVESHVQEFRTRLFQHQGINYPWLLKQADGMDVPKILNPNSEDLKNVFQKLKEDQYIVQQHVCNPMTWEEQQNFNIRNFWFVSARVSDEAAMHALSTCVQLTLNHGLLLCLQVASLDPLIVLYMDGYVRVGKNAHHNLSIAHNHETKSPFSQFEETIKRHHETHEQLQTRVMDPMTHVRNQCKEALSHLIEAFKEKNFQRESARDAFELFSANYIVDNDLDVWLLDAHDALDMDGMHAHVFSCFCGNVYLSLTIFLYRRLLFPSGGASPALLRYGDDT
jgi:hypothetical protein